MIQSVALRCYCEESDDAPAAACSVLKRRPRDSQRLADYEHLRCLTFYTRSQLMTAYKNAFTSSSANYCMLGMLQVLLVGAGLKARGVA